MTGRLLPTSKECMLCRLCAAAESEAVSDIARQFETDAESAIDSSSGICMAHLPGVLNALGAREEARTLIVREAAILERLSEDMRRYATKHDAIRRQLASQEESEAAGRAVAMVAGLPNVRLADDDLI